MAPLQVSQRHANSHAIVNGGFCATLDASNTVTSCKVVMGGVVASGLFVPSAAPEGLVGRNIADEAALKTFVTSLEAEAKAHGLSSDPQNTPDYRLALLRSFAYKFFLRANQKQLPAALASAVAKSLAAVQDRPVSSASQSIAVSDASLAPISVPMPKLSSLLQASGEARFSSDAPKMARELCGAFVATDKGAGYTLVGASFSACLAMPGVSDIG